MKTVLSNLKGFLLAFALVSGVTPSVAQKYMTRNGYVHFKSNALVDDDVEAVNRSMACALDAQTGEIAFNVLIKNFTFRKALMQEHFNENYMESDKYPKATYKGKIVDHQKIDFSKNGKYKVKLAGTLTIRDIPKNREDEAELEVRDGTIIITSAFGVACADHDIKIPKLVEDKIAKVIDVDFKVELKEGR
ncbi:MAG: YceI family protein [Thermaurantimonas sp.]|uniref:YceI family protein n=1 Tax=Thermaurantimonas sp. TaxID=2681568 RepID=UPI00391C745D